jgi:hypothetical protein
LEELFVATGFDSCFDEVTHSFRKTYTQPHSAAKTVNASHSICCFHVRSSFANLIALFPR